MNLLEELLDEIESLTEGDHWIMDIDHVLTFLEISREEFYKKTYQMRRYSDFERLETFSPESTNPLIELLVQCGYYDAPDRFHHAGYYFSQDQLIEWQEFFISVTMARLHSHEVDKDLLETAVSGCRRFKDAMEFYCRAAIDTDEMISFASNLYLARKKIADHPLSRKILQDYIRRQLHNRILRWEDIFYCIFPELERKAIAFELIQNEEELNIELTEEIKQAIFEMEFPGNRMPGESELKEKYRSLMKKYHPDVNPDGLEKSRRLNANYSFLITTLQAKP